MHTAIELHKEALIRARHFRKSQSALLDILVRMERHRIYQQFDFPSLSLYCLRYLKLSEPDAYALSSVAKKALEVPKLKSLIDEGKLHLSNARRIVSLLTTENQDIWLAKACELSQRNLRREIVRCYPEKEVEENISPISQTRSKLELGISTELEEKLARVCDLLSQKKKRAVKIEEAMEHLIEGFLEKNDPMRRANRNLCPDKGNEEVAPGRYISAQVDHAVTLRDGRQCCFVYEDGTRCEARRFLERHHVRLVSQGGGSEEPNLSTLCSFHHKRLHVRVG